MAIRLVRCLPDPILRKKARRIVVIDKPVLKLIEDMVDTLQDGQGLGLAAPQIGVDVRVIVLHMPDEEPFAMINPTVVKRIGEREVVEGCLSIPGYQGKIKRSMAVTVKGLESHGKPQRIKATGMLAQALEHEIDHLDGILYIDRLESPNKLYRFDFEQSEAAVGNL